MALIRSIIITLAVIFYLGLTLWCFGALWYSNLPWHGLRPAMAVIYVLLIAVFFVLAWIYPKIAMPVLAILPLMVVIWFMLIPASNNRDWQISCSRLPDAFFKGDMVTIKNIRDFKYRTVDDFDPHYITRTYDLNKVKTMDLAVVRWDGNQAIAHTMLSFGFSDGSYLAVSAETRLVKGQEQGGIEGLFKQYGIIYILGTEEDLFKLRTNYRREMLYLYPTTTTPAEAKRVLIDLLKRCNKLEKKPQFYNTLTYNCTNSLVPSISKIRKPRGFDIRVYLNGYSDWMAFDNGWLRHNPKDEFISYRARHLANLYVERIKNPQNYSQIIRTPFKSEK
jgi:hypothetical protein